MLSKVDLPPKNVLANLQNLTVKSARQRRPSTMPVLAPDQGGEHPALQPEIEQLKEAPDWPQYRHRPARKREIDLTDEAIRQLGRTVTDTLTRLRDCSSSARQVAPHHTLGSRTVEAWGLGKHEN